MQHSNFMSKSEEKASFRALRDYLGVPLSFIAEELQVRIPSVRRWEMLDCDQMPPADAWALLEREKESQDAFVQRMLDLVRQTHQDKNEPVRCNYYLNQEDYIMRTEDDPALYFQMANAITLKQRQVLESEGYTVIYGVYEGDFVNVEM